VPRLDLPCACLCVAVSVFPYGCVSVCVRAHARTGLLASLAAQVRWKKGCRSCSSGTVSPLRAYAASSSFSSSCFYSSSSSALSVAPASGAAAFRFPTHSCCPQKCVLACALSLLTVSVCSRASAGKSSCTRERERERERERDFIRND